MSSHGGLSKLYFTERKTFLAILNSIILCAPNKKTKNKLERFNFLLNKHDLYLGKVQFYIRLMHRLLINHKYQKHTKTIRVRSLMDEGGQNTSDLNKLPEIYVHFNKDNAPDLQLALADTGAQACIIGHKQLLELGFTENQIRPSESYNIRSSTEMVENAIKGKVKIKMFCLLKRDIDSNCGQFGRISIEFLVADDKINLQKVILGVPFMNQTSAKMHFHKNNCAIKCTLTTESGRKSVNLQLNDNKKLQLCNNTNIRVDDNECSFNMNKIITNISMFTFPIIENLKMPSKIKVNQQYTIISLVQTGRVSGALSLSTTYSYETSNSSDSHQYVFERDT